MAIWVKALILIGANMNFRTLVNGTEVKLGYLEVVTADGHDVENRLKVLNWPAKFWTDYGLEEKLQDLPKEEKAALLVEGLLRKEEGSSHVLPNWQVATHATRTQKFQAGKTVTVEHSYKPAAGGSVGGMLDMIARGEQENYIKEYAANYCIDKSFINGFRARQQSKVKQANAASSDNSIFYIGLIIC